MKKINATRISERMQGTETDIGKSNV